MKNEPSNKAKQLINKFVDAHANANDVFNERHARNEFYFSDIEGTLTQFTKYQKEFIENSYNIPISTKLAYPIIEQMMSFLTGPKPAPRLISPNNTTEDFVETMTKCFSGVWYESKADEELKKAIRDALAPGSGYLRVRKNNFFEETTFNTVIKHVPWWTVYVDPQSREADFRDAEYICIAEVMTKKKAEKQFDVKIKNVGEQEYPTNVYLQMPDLQVKEYWGITVEKQTIHEKWVIALEVFEKQENNVYISDDGKVSGDKPSPVEVPNPEKQAIKEEIDTMYSVIEQLKQQQKQSEQDQQDIQNQDVYSNTDEFNEVAMANQEVQQEQIDIPKKIQDLKTRIKQTEIKLTQTPAKVSKYEMETVKGETAIINSYNIIKKKQIKRTLLVNDQIIEEEILMSNKYPIHHIYIDHNGSPNKTYGMIHKIKDLIQAMNKFWSAMLYDVMSNNHRKVLYPQGSLVNNSDIEKKWNAPGGQFIEYIADPSLPNAGIPTVIEPSPLNQTYPQLIEMLKQLIEYVTGIHGVMQGNNSGATSTFGGIQSLQNFGTQRIKLYARNIENSLSDLAYNVVTTLQHYAPVDKVLTYFDDNNDNQEVRILNDFQDVQFKVRVDIVNSLPTQKQSAVSLLAMITQTTQDPQVAKLLTETMLKYMDMPEGKDILQQINTIEQLQSQLVQIQEQLKQTEGLNKSLTNNMEQLKAKASVEKEKERAIADIKTDKEIIKNQMTPNNEEEEEVIINEEPF